MGGGREETTKPSLLSMAGAFFIAVGVKHIRVPHNQQPCNIIGLWYIEHSHWFYYLTSNLHHVIFIAIEKRLHVKCLSQKFSLLEFLWNLGGIKVIFLVFDLGLQLLMLRIYYSWLLLWLGITPNINWGIICSEKSNPGWLWASTHFTHCLSGPYIGVLGNKIKS